MMTDQGARPMSRRGKYREQRAATLPRSAGFAVVCKQGHDPHVIAKFIATAEGEWMEVPGTRGTLVGVHTFEGHRRVQGKCGAETPHGRCQVKFMRRVDWVDATMAAVVASGHAAVVDLPSHMWA